MKKAEAVFVLHGDVNRKSKILNLLGGDVNIVIWPGVDHKDAVSNLEGYDPEKHHLLEIGSREKLYIGRNNIIDYCKENGIKRFWMLDDDVSFRMSLGHEEWTDKVCVDGKVHLMEADFEDEVGLGGMTMSGVMFNNHRDAPKYSNRFIWAAIFIDLDYNNIRYTVEGYDDIDMQLECVKNGIKTQTHNWIGQTKPNWLNKKSLNSQMDKINYNNYLIYRKWKDTVKMDVYYDKAGNKYFRVHVKWPYKIKDHLDPKFNIDSLESFVESLEHEYATNPSSFKICGLPHLKKEAKSKKA